MNKKITNLKEQDIENYPMGKYFALFLMGQRPVAMRLMLDYNHIWIK
jgi:hypothetical protein